MDRNSPCWWITTNRSVRLQETNLSLYSQLIATMDNSTNSLQFWHLASLDDRFLAHKLSFSTGRTVNNLGCIIEADITLTFANAVKTLPFTANNTVQSSIILDYPHEPKPKKIIDWSLQCFNNCRDSLPTFNVHHIPLDRVVVRGHENNTYFANLTHGILELDAWKFSLTATSTR